MRRAPLVYRLLLRLYPPGFRARFGPEMEDTFAAWEAVTGRMPMWGRLRFRVAALRDVLAGAAREWWWVASGGPAPVTGTVRRGGGAMSGWTTDLRVAVRGLARRPGLTAAAVATLALGIGATTAVFSVSNGILFRPFGYDDERALVHIWSQNPERGWTDIDVTLPDAWAWRTRTDAFADVAAFTYVGVTDRGRDVPVRLDGLWATPNVLDVLGVRPALGRGFTPDDAVEGASEAVVVSHGYWVRALGADHAAIGREVVFNGVPRTVVGVLPEDFRFLAAPVDVFIPYAGDPADGALDQHSWQAIARLADGATLESAGAAVREVGTDMARRYPDTHEGFTASVIGLRAELVGDVAGTAAVVLLGAVGFVLLMACVNVANLLLSRARERQGEMAVRTALGATRRRLVRQLMAEALLLSVVGGVAGAVIAIWGHRVIVGGLPSFTPPALTFDLDVRVLLFSAGVVMASAILFGLVPALRTVQPAGDLREAGRGGTARATGGTLVVVQTALAVVLLAGGVAMTRGVLSLHGQDRGWSAEGVLTARLSPRSADYPDAASITDFHGAVLDAVRAVPGVEGAGAAYSIPLQGSNQVASIQMAFAVDGRSEMPVRVTRLVPGYLDALRIRLRAGRDVTDADRLDTEPVALVNERFVERYLGGGDALDGGFTWASADGPVRIVGVVEDHIERAVDRPLEPSIYVPMAQVPTWTRTLVVRTAGDPAALVPALRAAVARVDPTVPLFDVQTMPERVSERMAGFDLLAKLMGAFAVVSLALGAVGIYGVTARGVARRTREIGLRLALGADPGEVRRRIVGQSLRRVGLGMVLGLLLAVPLVGALQGLVVGIDPRSPASFVPALLVLLIVAGLGAWLPARSASRIDPVRALAAD